MGRHLENYHRGNYLPFCRGYRLAGMFLAAAIVHTAHAAEAQSRGPLPVPLDSYRDSVSASLLDVLVARVEAVPFNAVATLIFVLAIIHTFLTAKFLRWAHLAEMRNKVRRARGVAASTSDNTDSEPTPEVSFQGQVLHFLGEVEAVFGIWVIVLAGAIACFYGWQAVLDYIGREVEFTEAMFVVVVMAIAGTQPILRVAESFLRALAALGGGRVGAWWLSILIVAPLLGSLITEPAAMTIAALLLTRQFYAFQPSLRLRYATLGLLFVNVSVGGTLTHFAAPPVLMVASPWHWGMSFMFLNFGWKAVLGIVLSTGGYYLIFRRELGALEVRRQTAESHPRHHERDQAPFWVTAIQVGFLAFTVAVAHYPPLFIGGFLFFLAFTQATARHQGPLELRSPLLVGFFLAGLVVHGGLQNWWIDPVLKRLSELPLFLGATLLTAFNDNAAITYLATLVPGFTPALKYAVVAGAVTGGGLTVIANAPNPAGQSLLQRHFPDGVSPLRLASAALLPTIILGLCFWAL